MAAHPDPGGRRHQTSVSLSVSDLESLDALCDALHVSRSLAISHLIDLHAGRETERALEVAHKAFPVVRWARPKLGPDLIGYLAGLVRAGNLIEVAASMAGVTPRQLADWRRRGRHDLKNGIESVYADLIANLDAAQAESEAEALAEIRRAGQKDWRASTWYLSHLFPDRYGERKRIDRTSQVNLVPVIDYERLTLSELRVLVELLRKASPEQDDPRLTKTARPALELLPPDVVEHASEAPPIGETIEGEATEAPPLESEDRSPGPREAPLLDTVADPGGGRSADVDPPAGDPSRAREDRGELAADDDDADTRADDDDDARGFFDGDD